jgi:protein-L-isoaspartate(D-aspartate) O-methyltransferase
MKGKLTKGALIKKWRDQGLVNDQKVLEAFVEIQRERFMPSAFESKAYDDVPVGIGFGQTISQPFTVLAMIELLNLEKTDKVLEIGAGSGYQAAILSQLANQVYTLEIIPELVEMAQGNLAVAKIDNVEVVQWDGSQGYGKEAPYDKIIVSSACREIPKDLVAQLKEGGIIVAPVGGRSTQVDRKSVV